MQNVDKSNSSACFNANSRIRCHRLSHDLFEFKGTLTRGSAVSQVKNLLKSLLSSFVHTQNSPVTLSGIYQKNSGKENKP